MTRAVPEGVLGPSCSSSFHLDTTPGMLILAVNATGALACSVSSSRFRLPRASIYLLVMVAVAVAEDRLPRHLGLARGRFPE